MWKIHLETYDPAKYEAYENNYYDCYDMVSLTGELGGGEEPWLDSYAVIANVKLRSDIMGLGYNITDREPGVAYGGRLKSAVVRVSCVVVLECVGLDAHLSDFTPPDIFKPGLLEKALKKYNKAEKLPTRRLEFD